MGMYLTRDSLCGGSITAFSLYGPLFQDRLHYTQYRVNLVSIVAEVSLYLLVPLLGFLCDRFGPRPISVLAAVNFGVGYFLAAFTYKSGPPEDTGAGNGWPFGVMVLAFIGIGMGTSAMYLAGVTTCAKNFGRGNHKGFALAAPIASFGLSGMWQSQIGSHLLYELNPDGSKGELDVHKYFLFLGGLLSGVGLIGAFLLRIVDEGELIDEAVDELERSGLLNDHDFFQPRDYGTLGTEEPSTPFEVVQERKQRQAEDERKKRWLLWEETKRFLSDRTMWWLAAGFFLVTGPGEAFINNLGTIIGTLYPHPHRDYDTGLPTESHNLPRTTPATHVSIVAITSTFARLASGTLSDLLSPPSNPHQHHRGPTSLTASVASLDPLARSTQSLPQTRKLTLSRLTLLLFATILMSAGMVLLASGVVQNHAHDRFWLVTAFVGTGYGAAFSLVPIIISCVWGVENFGTNWGIVAVVPAFGAAVWGVVYAAVYDNGIPQDVDLPNIDGRCFGKECYQLTFWLEAAAIWVACLLWLWAWRGPGGWRSRGVAV